MSGVDTGDWMRVLFLVLLLVFLGGGLMVEGAAGRNRQLRQLASWAVIIGVLAAGAAWWQDRQAAPRLSADGARIEVPLGPDGHFHLTAEVNGAPVRFLVDTGASSLVLSPADARAAGLDPARLDYRNRAMTANGPVASAPVRLDSLRIGEITDRDVAADVNSAEMQGSLMGMSYLSRFARVSIERGRLILDR